MPFVNIIITDLMSHSTYSTASEKRSNKEKPCKVLLVCVYQTIIFEITNQLIFQKFSIYGSITKILIFDKGQVTKFFIEFGQTSQAYNAKTALDGSKFFENICKINIYFSNFHNVDLKHNSTEGADYEFIQQQKSNFVQNFDNLTKSSQQQNIDFLNDDILMQTFSPFGNSNSFHRSKTQNPKTLQNQINKMQWSAKMTKIQEQQVDKQIKNQIQTLLSQGDFQMYSQKQSSPYSPTSPKKNISMVIKQQSGYLNNNTVIYYDLTEWILLKNIYNLFSNFGNIQFITSKKSKVYIKFRSGYFAAVAMNYLSGMNFCGNVLNLRYCQNQDEYIQKPMQYSQCIYFQQSFDRFTPKRSITVNPPSLTLHVSSIKKQNCNENSLRKIFGAYGRVDKVKILMQSNQKNMALIMFASVNQSFQAISDLHNKVLGGRKMQISFTKSKL